MTLKRQGRWTRDISLAGGFLHAKAEIFDAVS